MQKLLSKTNGVIEKARKLNALYMKLQGAHGELQGELKRMQLALEAEQLKNSELNNKIKIIKLAQNIGSERTDENAEVLELKRKVNEYIREIDNCIAMLND
ncbi:MAG: hypothetical protein JWO06_3935 [Bacteroidota bacterium]|nr:hypothetical protein [Bacteroidota bacterium]